MFCISNDWNRNTLYYFHIRMIFPHLLLCKTTSENDESLSKTKARRFKQLQDGKTLQMRSTKGSRKKTEIEAQQFNKVKNNEQVSEATAKIKEHSKWRSFARRDRQR